MTYYKKMELNNPHRKYIILLMKKCAIGVPPWSEFFRKAKLVLPESTSKTEPS